jgi:ADP-dependent phosphofructokinase/glucokinase
MVLEFSDNQGFILCEITVFKETSNSFINTCHKTPTRIDVMTSWQPELHKNSVPTSKKTTHHHYTDWETALHEENAHM